MCDLVCTLITFILNFLRREVHNVDLGKARCKPRDGSAPDLLFARRTELLCHVLTPKLVKLAAKLATLPQAAEFELMPCT